jgi:hypothetical protein
LQQGLQQGKQEGLEVSREKLRGALLRLWRTRYANPAPPEVQDAARAQTDVDELSRWLDAVASAGTEEEVRRVILG